MGGDSCLSAATAVNGLSNLGAYRMSAISSETIYLAQRGVNLPDFNLLHRQFGGTSIKHQPGGLPATTP
jgi:hypothetical protein